MTWFWLTAGLLILGALAALLRPLLRHAGGGGREGEAAAAIFRRQLADIDAELAQGRLGPDEASTAQAELTRRMLAAADRVAEEVDPTAADPDAEPTWARLVFALPR